MGSNFYALGKPNVCPHCHEPILGTEKQIHIGKLIGDVFHFRVHKNIATIQSYADWIFFLGSEGQVVDESNWLRKGHLISTAQFHSIVMWSKTMNSEPIPITRDSQFLDAEGFLFDSQNFS